MTSRVEDLDKPFIDVFRALDLKDQRKAMRSAVRREGNKLHKQAIANLRGAKIGQGSNQPLSKGIRLRVYPDKYGMGFMLSVMPSKKYRKGFHVNRKGLTKPVLLWAEEGTKLRMTKSKTRFFVRKRKGHFTGQMKGLGFIKKAEAQADQIVEPNLFGDFQKNLDKAARRRGLL